MNDHEEYIKVDILFLDEKDTISSTSISSNEDRVIMSGDDFPPLPHGLEVSLVGYLEDGLVFMTGKVFLATQYQINLGIDKINKKENRRTYIRVKAHNMIILSKACSLGRCQKNYSLNEVIETRDINLGGLGFYSNRRLLLKQRVLLDFSFLKPGMMIEAKILRAEKNLSSLKYKYKYGSCFMNRNAEEERIICEYVFKMQIENHRRSMLLKEEKER